MNWAKITARQDEEKLCYGTLCILILEIWRYIAWNTGKEYSKTRADFGFANEAPYYHRNIYPYRILCEYFFKKSMERNANPLLYQSRTCVSCHDVDYNFWPPLTSIIQLWVLNAILHESAYLYFHFLHYRNNLVWTDELTTIWSLSNKSRKDIFQLYVGPVFKACLLHPTKCTRVSRVFRFYCEKIPTEPTSLSVALPVLGPLGESLRTKQVASRLLIHVSHGSDRTDITTAYQMRTGAPFTNMV